ncbi:hypothetical protein OG218_23275 [Kineococcus sp. NBC_00420]|uniref:hypothetical protein n=1 Tax=unclassified Kineococcus TaxID=2621656 RepID=UPI002E23DF29
MSWIPDSLRPVLHEQHGLLTRRQLYDAGVSTHQIRWALGREWRLVHGSVVATTTGRLDPAQRLVAAQLFAGPGAQIGSTTAARYFGLTSVPEDGVRRLFVPWGAKSRERPGVSVRRTRRPDPHEWSRGPLAFTSPPRTVVDAARQLRGDAVRAVVFEAVQRRFVTVDHLASEVEAGAVRGSAAVRAAVQEVSGGAWSIPESELADLLASSSVLPTVLLNPVLTTVTGETLPSPDGFVDEVGLALQVHSRSHHFAEEDWEWTLRSDTALGTAGVPVMAFSPRTLRSDGRRVLRAVERAYLALRRATRPAVVARPRLAV